MKNFKISILQLNGSTYTSIPIGQSSSTINSSPFTTYNEKLTQKTNSQQELSFSMTLYYNQQRNPFWDMLLNNQYLRLLLLTNDEIDESIDFIITKITPTISPSNISYSITAQDLFSYQLSKQGIGLTYKTEIPLQINELATNILKESNVTHWKVDPLLEQKVFPDFPNTLYESGTYERMKCSLDLSGSTCYNALVEIANLFNAIIRVSYNENKPGGTIYFINKDRIQFKGYRLLPTVNLNAFTFNKDSSNFSSLMYVTGGQDAEGAMVSIIPTMPSMISEWLDMYQVYEELPSPQLHNYPVAVAREGNNTKLYSLNITKGTSDNRFLGLYEEYGVGEELQCSITFDDPYNASDSYQVIMEGTGTPKSFVASSTFGASLNQTVVNINITLEEEGTVYLTLLKNGDIVANSRPFLIKYATWVEGPLFSPWEEEKNFTNLVSRIWNDDNVKKWRNTEGNTLVDIRNYCFMIQNNVKAVGEFLYNFDYFYENDMMDEETYQALERMFSLNLRNANLKTQILTKQYNSLSYLLRQLVQREEELVSLVSTAFEQIYEYYKEGTDLNTTISSALYSSKNPALTSEIEQIIRGSFDQSLSPDVESSSDEEDPDITTLQQNCYNQITLAIQDLVSTVWTEKYFRLAFMMYGTNYFQELRETNRKKRQEYTNNYFDYLDKAQEILNQVEGKDEQEKINNLTYLQQCDYYYYIGKADGIAHLADFYYNEAGEVNRTSGEGDYPFLKLGYYGCYNLLIGQLVLLNNKNYNNILTSYTWYDSSIVKRLEEQERIRKEIWATIYENYSPYIIESSYNDSTQLTSSGLYGAAVKQFATLCYPTVDYSATIIDYSMITDANYDTIQIGDKVKVYNDLLFQKKVKNIILVQTKDGSAFNSLATSITVGEEGSDPEQYSIINKERLTNNTFRLTLDKKIPYFQFHGTTFTNTDPQQKLTILDYAYVSEPVELQITGITKTLREQNMQLTVQNNQTINSLVDKLLYSIRKS